MSRRCHYCQSPNCAAGGEVGNSLKQMRIAHRCITAKKTRPSLWSCPLFNSSESIVANLITRQKSQFISIPYRDSRQRIMRDIYKIARSQTLAIFRRRENCNNQLCPVAAGNRQSPDPEKQGAGDSTAQNQPVQISITDKPETDNGGMILLEKIVLFVALILLAIAAVNTAIAIYPQSNPQRPEVIQ